MQPKRIIDRTLTRRSLLGWLAATGCTIPTAPERIEPPVASWGPPVEVMRFSDQGEPLGVNLLPSPVRNETRWRAVLSPRAYAVLREGATEPPFSSTLAKPAASGVYRCAGCDLAVFAAATQFESETGWPSFTEPLDARNIRIEWDLSWGVRRRAVRCALCGGHLGHVFGDGPPPSYRRYCLNGVALRLSA